MPKGYWVAQADGADIETETPDIATKALRDPVSTGDLVINRDHEGQRRLARLDLGNILTVC